MPARFIVVEGPDGTGKTTLADHLESALASAGEAPLRVRDPGGTLLGDALRAELLHAQAGGRVDALAELYMFCAARAQLASEVIVPALASGRTVLADRYWLSTLAYQGALPEVARVWPDAELRRLVRAGLEEAEPTHWILLEAPASVGLSRCGRGGGPDRLESRGLEYFELVAGRYAAESRLLPPGRVWRVDATGTAAEVAREAMAAVAR